MPTADPASVADAFYRESRQHPADDLLWLRQQQFRLQSAVRKAPAEVAVRAALGTVFACLGDRDLAVAEAEIGYGLRHTGNPRYLIPLAVLAMNLGFADRACGLIGECASRPELLALPSARRAVRFVGAASGDIDRWRTTLADIRGLGLPGVDPLLDLVTETRATGPYAQHQALVLALTADRLCRIDLTLSFRDGRPLVSQRYHTILTEDERAALQPRWLAAEARCFAGPDGGPDHPFRALLERDLRGLPADFAEGQRRARAIAAS